MDEIIIPTYKCFKDIKKNKLKFICPHCKVTHYHGASDQFPGEDHATHRLAHCRSEYKQEDGPHSNGYFVYYL